MLHARGACTATIRPMPMLPDDGPVILDAARALDRAQDLCAFVDASPMPHLAVAECARRLSSAGYTELREDAPWSLVAGAKHYVVRAGTTLLAFEMGGAAPEKAGICGFGAHLDSPNLRIKPNPDTARLGYTRLAIETYGGLIVASWLDRDLGIAGNVVVRRSGGETASRLVDIRRPVARCPNLAIHLSRNLNEDGLKVDTQAQLPPITGTLGMAEPGEAGLRALLSAELDVAPDDILDWDLGLMDVQASALGGVHQEFVFAPRLDNLAMSHAGLVALIEAGEQPSDRTRLIALFDHEECGSQSVQGAQGSLLMDVIRRLSESHPGRSTSGHETTARAAARSFLVSADMAHAMHPGYPEKYEPGNHPYMNRGPAIKRNVNQRYATDGETGAWFAEYCRSAGFEPQQYVHRTGLRCGSTIGAMVAAGSGLRTVDVGNPMLAMHSIRETGGALDPDLMIQALQRHFA